MKERLLKLIRDKHESDAEFEKALGLKEKTVDTWKRGKSAAYFKMIPELCNHFQVSADYLLERSDNITNINNSVVAQGQNAKAINKTNNIENNHTNQNSTLEETELLRIFNSLDVRGRLKILNLAFELEENSKL